MEPTTGDVTEPTSGNSPTEPGPKSEPEPEMPKYDFTGITAGTITDEIYNSWDDATRQAWLIEINFLKETTIEDRGEGVFLFLYFML